MIPPSRIPAKRNRNIGTKKSGYKTQSPFDIPLQNRKPFYQAITIQTQCRRDINGKPFTFLIEKLSANYIHVCSIDEICAVLRRCPPEDLDGLALIILRQPKKKERVLSPCWGRLIYQFEYRGVLQPAIILESVNLRDDITMKATGVSLFFQRELELLRQEGHDIERAGKKIIIKSTLQAVKRTQLYRTLLHEVGHYVQYKKAHKPSSYEEKETFANTYAKAIRDTIPGIDRP